MELMKERVIQMSFDSVMAVTALICCLILVISYSIRSLRFGKSDYERVEKQGSSSLLNKNVMNMAYWGLEPVGDLLIKLGLRPNTISWASLFFGVLAGLVLSVGHFGFGGVFAAISALLDSVDGMVARKTGVASDSGEVLDAAVDRYSEFFFISGLMIYYREMEVLLILCLAALLGSFMVSYSTAKAEALHISPPRGNMRRTERALYLTLGAILTPISIQMFEPLGLYPVHLGYPMIFALGMIAVLSNISAVQRLAHIARSL